MTRLPVVRVGACLAFALCMPSLLSGQAQESCVVRASHPGTTGFGASSAELPVDRISDILALGPGVSALDNGNLSVRNGGTTGNAIFVNGVPVTPGTRFGQATSFGGSYFGPGGPGIRVGTNAYQSLRLTSGLLPIDLGNLRGGAIEVETAACEPALDSRPLLLRAGVASDALFGASNGLGFNRITVNGQTRFGRLEIGGAAVVEGQKSARLGMNQNDSPIYVSTGSDTTVTFDDDGEERTVDILGLRASDGIRIPQSASSRYTVSGQVGYYLGQRHRLQLTGLASQGQERGFSYADLYNPRQTLGVQSSSQVLTGSWFGTLSQSERMTLSAEAHLSLQWDHGLDGPLSDAGERDTRDPSLGLMLSRMDFRFDGDNFPVNQQLINNFRTNTGRVSPYDVLNPDQYSLIDRYRNNAYGLLGFSEGGGPVGVLTIHEEKRLVGKGIVAAQLGGMHRVRLGLEATSYDVNYYSSQLTSQAFSNAYIESPSSQALFGEYRLTLPSVTVTGGLRYDRFKSGASRSDFPRLSSDPEFDPENPTATMSADKSHDRVSPRVSVVGQASPRIRYFGGFTSLAQQPDFAAVFSGINTDLAVTNLQYVYGSDLGYERSVLIEAGADAMLDSSTTLTGALWTRRDDDLVAARLVTGFDPLTERNFDVRRMVNTLHGSTSGVDLRITRALGEHGQAWVSYGYADPAKDLRTFTREHNIAAAVMYQTGRESSLFGGVLRNTEVYGVFRAGSGTRYTRCEAFTGDNIGVLSGEACTGIEGEVNGQHLPAFKVMDLRVTRGFTFGNTELVGFVDARNLLNLRSITRVFATNGKIRDQRELEQVRIGALDGYGTEAATNGVRGLDGTIDLTFGGAADPRSACGNWRTSQSASPPNCIYLIGAEERFGNGDGLFTLAEQTRAIDAFYHVRRGEQYFTAPGRRVRLGIEVRF